MEKINQPKRSNINTFRGEVEPESSQEARYRMKNKYPRTKSIVQKLVMAALSGLIVFGGAAVEAEDQLSENELKINNHKIYTNNGRISKSKDLITGAAADLSKGTLDILHEQNPNIPQSGYSMTGLTKTVDGDGNTIYKNSSGEIVDAANVVTKYETVDINKYYDKTTNTLVGADERQDGVEYIEIRTKEAIPHYFEKTIRANIPDADTYEPDTTGMTVINASNYTGYITDSSGAIEQTISDTVYDTIPNAVVGQLTNSDTKLTFNNVILKNSNYFIANNTSGTITGISGAFVGNSSSYALISNKATIGDINADFVDNGGVYLVRNEGADADNIAQVGNITGNFVGNTTSGGGAIYNSKYVKVGDITGNFINNNGNFLLYNYNNSSIGDITGDFIGNKATGVGLIINDNSVIGDINGDFIDNRGPLLIRNEGADADNIAQVGNITGNFVGNTTSGGGAIYNSKYVKVGDITGNFINNNGNFLLYNYNNSSIGDITGDFIGNKATGGGLIINDNSVIGDITGDFIDNKPTNSNYNSQAVIINRANSQIGNITGDFNNSYGFYGAIYNQNSTIGNITGNFSNYNANHFEGGAITNKYGVIGDITGNFIADENRANLNGQKRTRGIYNQGNWNSSTNIATTGIIGNITGDFINNTGHAGGGAIVNKYGKIGVIKGDFINNATDVYGGGGIYNGGFIEGIEGNYLNNTTIGSEGGGAIYNGYYPGSVIGYITGDFVNNRTENIYQNNYNPITIHSNSMIFGGGAIGNGNNSQIGDINGNFINNHAEIGGGAINNIYRDYGSKPTSINNINGNFYNNTAYSDISNSRAYGGAIWNTAKIGNISGDFDRNYAVGDLNALGGAIVNAQITGKADSGIIGNIDGNFTNNYVLQNSTTDVSDNYTEQTGARGGAIYNYKNSSQIGYIHGDFINNHAISNSTVTASGSVNNISKYLLTGAMGGALYNDGIIGDVISKISENYAKASANSAYGGAIYNTGTMGSGSVLSQIQDNYAEGGDAAMGGAIYNTGTMGKVQGDLLRNYAKSLKYDANGNVTGGGTANGGAIYNTGTITGGVIGDIIGNYAEGYYPAQGGAIYNTSANFTLDAINGEISNNHVKSYQAPAQGGAIYMTSGTINGGAITAIVNNYAECASGTQSAGGAIFAYNSNSSGTQPTLNFDSIGEISGNYVKDKSRGDGGAIFVKQGTIGEITGDIKNNYIEAVSGYNSAVHVTGGGGGKGGALASSLTINSIKGDVINNHVLGAYEALGGAIYNGYFGGGSINFDGSDLKDNWVKALTYDANDNVVNGGVAAGGALYNYSGATVTGTLGEISGNYADMYSYYGQASGGGAIWNNSANFNLTGITGDIKDNHTKMYMSTSSGPTFGGGAIWNNNTDANLGTISSSEISDNYAESSGLATYGGAIYNTGKMAFGTNGTDLLNNHASSLIKDANGNVTGGGTANGGAIYNTGTITGGVIGDITDNYAEGYGYANGGAIFNTSANFTLDAINGEISNNHVSVAPNTGGGMGGAIYMDNGTINGGIVSQIKNNYVSGQGYAQSGANAGGAIFARSAATINFDEVGEISGNYVEAATGDADAGAIMAKGSIGVIKGDIKNNHVKSGSTYDANGNLTNGGRAYSGAMAISMDIGDIQGDITDNYAESLYFSQGGAIYNGYFGAASIKISGDVKNNYARSYMNSPGAYGGAIFNNNGAAIEFNGSDLIGNYAKAYSVDADDNPISGGAAAGGALYNNSGATVTGTLGEISGNYADMYSYYGQAYGGGAIWNNSANFNLTGITGDIKDNHTKMYMNITGSGPTFGGGAIWNNNTNANLGTISSSKISDNYAESAGLATYGGAIYNTGKMAIGTNGTDLLNNHVSSLIKDANGNVTGGNSAYGGAIYNTGAVSGGVIGDIIGNYAEGYGYALGGAIYNTSANFTLDAINGEISNNHVSVAPNTGEGRGGAIYNDRGNLGTILSPKISGNYAEGSSAVYGGAIYNTGKMAFGTNGTDLLNNHASSLIKDADGNVTGGGQAQGGAIYNTGTVSGGVIGDIIGNYAEGYGAQANGGAIYNTSANFTLDAINGEISNNHAKSYNIYAQGGAIYMTAGTVKGGTVTDIIGNYTEGHWDNDNAPNGGGALYIGDNVNFKLDAITGDIKDNHAIGGSMPHGGAIYLGKNGSIGSITSDYITGNYTETVSSSNNRRYSGSGGVIFNKGKIGDITAQDVSSNHITGYAFSAGDGGGGGVIANAGSIGNITFTEAHHNYVDGYVGAGGVITNIYSSTIKSINGNFHDNYVEGKTGAIGGAIWNYGRSGVSSIGDIKGDFTNNHVSLTDGTDTYNVESASGGAIYNGYFGGVYLGSGGYTEPTKYNIASITGDFTSNYATSSAPTGSYKTASGGAISNNYFNNISIGDIKGNFTGNYAQADNTAAVGGAVLNNGYINSIEGDFEQNYINGKYQTENIYNNNRTHQVNYTYTLYTRGGAIFNSGRIPTVKGNFTKNSVTATDGMAFGGAIDNSGTIDNLSGNFTRNSAVAQGDAAARGGAIYMLANNSSFKNNISGVFDGNYVKGKTSTNVSYNGISYQSNPYQTAGGAIAIDRSYGNVTLNNSSFLNNYAESLDENDALGGAIFTQENISINADNYDSIFQGNYVKNTNTTTNNAIYVDYIGGRLGINFDPRTLTFNLTNGGQVHMYDAIDGFRKDVYNDENVLTDVKTYAANITGDDRDTTTFHMFNDITNGKVTTSNVTMNLVNDTLRTNNVGNLISDDTTAYKIDIDFANQKADQIKTSITGSDGTVVLHDLNVITGKPVEGKIQVLDLFGDDTNNDLHLAFSNEMEQKWVVNDQKVYTGETGRLDITEDTVIRDTLWSDLLYRRYKAEYEDIYVKLNIDTTHTIDDSIAVSTRTETYLGDVFKTELMGDTLALVSQADIGTRNFITDNPEDIYTPTSDLGEAAAGELTIKGVTEGDKKSTINLADKKGFELVNETTLNFEDINITGTKPIATVTNSDAVINIQNSNIHGDIQGNGNDINVKGANTTTDLDGVITNADTTLTDATLTFNTDTFKDNADTLHVVSGRVDLQDNSVDTYEINKLTSESDGRYSIDLDLNSETADVLKISDNTSSGVVYIDEINYLNGTLPKEFTAQVLDTNNNNNIQIQLSDAIKDTVYNFGQVHEDWDDMKANVFFDETIHDFHRDGNLIGSIKEATTHTTNDSIKLKIDGTDWGATQTTNRVDTLHEIAVFDAPDKTFSFRNSDDSYEAKDNIGDVINKVSIIGVSDNENKSAIDLKNYDGFNLTNGSELNLSDVSITGQKPIISADNANSVVNIQNSNIHGDIQGNGNDINVKGANTTTDLDGVITNADTTLTDATLTFNTDTFKDNADTLHVVSGRVDLQDNSVDTYEINKLTSESDGRYSIDLDLNSETADVLKISDNTSSGVVYIDEINYLNGTLPKEFTAQVLDTNNNNNIQIQLSDAIKDTVYNFGQVHEDWDDMKANVFFDETIHDFHRDGTSTGSIKEATIKTTNDAIALAKETVWGDVQTTNRVDTLHEISKYNENEKTFNFKNSNDEYKAKADIGTLNNKLTVNGKSDNNSKTKIDFNGYKGFEPTANSELVVNDTKLANAKDDILINATDNSAVITLNNPDLEGKITGKSGYKVNLTGSSEYTYNVNDEIENANISMENITAAFFNPKAFATSDLTINSGTIDMTADRAVADLAAKSVVVNNHFKLFADADLQNEVMDKLPANTVVKGGAINVAGLNLLSDTEKPSVAIPFAYKGFKDNVEYTAKTLDKDTQLTTAYSPIYRYDVSYDNRDDMGYFVFARHGIGSTNSSEQFNPAVLASNAVAQAGANSAMNQALYYAFEHGDTFMNGSAFDRFAAINKNTYALSTDFDGNIGLSDLEHKNKSVWVKPYSVFEKIDLKNGPKIDTISYGSLIGFDSDIHKLKHGWANVGTAYLGYNGSQVKYNGIDASTNGGILGLTETFYKGNFWTALTATAGASNAEAHTMYGRDDMVMLMAGIGSKTGYNFEFNQGKFIIQPRLFMAYSMVKTLDYTNAAGVRIDTDPMHTIQINPAIKFIGNTKSGWQPYASIGMNWNLMNTTKGYANNVRLPEMHTKPYVEYGLGVQKHWNDKYSAYGQAMVRNGGRNGIALTLGFRWALGSEGKPIEKVQNKNNTTASANRQKQNTKAIKQLTHTQKAKLNNSTLTTMKGFVK